MSKSIAAALACMAVVGCGWKAPPAPPSPAMLKATVVLPNALAETVDHAMLPAMREVLDGPHAPAVTCVSHDGLFEAYIDGNSPIGEQEVRMRFARAVGKLTIPAREFVVQRTSGLVPSESTSAPALQLRLDRERMAALGVSETDVLAAIPTSLPQGGKAAWPGELSNATVRNRDGNLVPLLAVMTFEEVLKRSRIVRKLPSR